MSPRQNHRERLELSLKIRMAEGLVSDLFPGVSAIVLHLTYYQGAYNPLLMVRTLNFLPADYAYFRMECTKEECTNGGFDLAPAVSALVKGRKKTGKGKLMCCGKNSGLPTGHTRIEYEVSIQYGK